jgi:hypothetical protein
MAYKKARYEMEVMELKIFCPHCGQPAKPEGNAHSFLWTRRDITLREIECRDCHKNFMLPAGLIAVMSGV